VARKATGEEILEIWKMFGIFLEFFGRGGKWMTVYLHGGNGSRDRMLTNHRYLKVAKLSNVAKCNTDIYEYRSIMGSLPSPGEL
jgi:hypothetical protein